MEGDIESETVPATPRTRCGEYFLEIDEGFVYIFESDDPDDEGYIADLPVEILKAALE